VSFSDPRQVDLEKRMRELLDLLDDYLEQTYDGAFRLHPNRPPRGRAARVAYDGLFSTGVKFTLGYGSEAGKGYLVDVEISTLDRVEPEKRTEIEKDAVRFLSSHLKDFFPERDLAIVKDGKVYKIVGDFSLGTL